MFSIAKGATRVSGEEVGVTIAPHSRRGWRAVAAGLAGLVCAIALAGCGPLPTVEVVRSGVAIEGGSCDITVNASNLAPNTTYAIGMYTTGSPADLGTLTSNSSGLIENGMLSYPSDTFPRHYSNLNVEVYTDNSGQLGAGLTSAPVTIEVCLPTGLAP